ncbi:MAG TPA: 5-(carboxyamino)imidazole ribonucleotide synthase [Gemmataceae bacterium]|nr:5-(carboxyamino)imidazole ribonucleotide synthase [Gemmataceae bacterium]
MTTVGVLGGGQLGRMLALAGLPLGLRFRFLDPAEESPAGQVAERMVGAFDDPNCLLRFAEGLDVVTYEFENVPTNAARLLAERVPVYPPPVALETSQDRLAEKELFQRLNVPTTRNVAVESQPELLDGLRQLRYPAVLKTRRLGYDGKGQAVLRGPEDADRAWRALGGRPLLLEEFIPFDRELSQIAVRGCDGAVAFYPLVENHHEHGILRWSLAPAPDVSAELQSVASDYALRILRELNYVGVLAVEFFQSGGGLIANEMAPRVHNSGHWTIEGAETSQFDNHLRAVVGWPLGSTAAVGSSAMLNLIGTTPDAAALLALPRAHLHLYGKAPRRGRKLGHVTLRANSIEEARRRLAAARSAAQQ